MTTAIANWVGASRVLATLIMLLVPSIVAAQAPPGLGTEEFGLSQRELVQAIERTEELIAKCMREQGFQYIAVDHATVRAGMAAEPAKRERGRAAQVPRDVEATADRQVDAQSRAGDRADPREERLRGQRVLGARGAGRAAHRHDPDARGRRGPARRTARLGCGRDH